MSAFWVKSFASSVTLIVLGLAAAAGQDKPKDAPNPFELPPPPQPGAAAPAPAPHDRLPSPGTSVPYPGPDLLPVPGPWPPEGIKPLPLTPIPDDPPPHEGAMIDIPYVVQPPDLLYVSVLEALPGRPIDGERLVRADGTISLNFYGILHVAGLTCLQVKEKLIRHLRNYLSDEVLGLVSTARRVAGGVSACLWDPCRS